MFKKIFTLAGFMLALVSSGLLHAQEKYRLKAVREGFTPSAQYMTLEARAAEILRKHRGANARFARQIAAREAKAGGRALEPASAEEQARRATEREAQEEQARRAQEQAQQALERQRKEHEEGRLRAYAVTRSRHDAEEARKERMRLRREASAREERNRRYEVTNRRMEQLYSLLREIELRVPMAVLNQLRRVAYLASDTMWSQALDGMRGQGQLLRFVRELEERERRKEEQKQRVQRFLAAGGLQPNVQRATAPPDALQECVICLEKISEAGEEFLNYKTLCGHFFHASDLERHLRESGDIKCPLCRQDVVNLPR